MRFKETKNGVSVHAIAGTHVVLLGIDMPPEQTAGLLGFAIHRTDPTEDEAYWLTGMRTFEASYPNPPDGALVSTYEHPIQDFMWSDFTAKPDRHYVYRVVPVRGKPKKLVYDEGVTIEVETEPEIGDVHSVHFNRGVIGSQAYARKWAKAPDDLPADEREKALEWLSRGLDEAILAFIAQADAPRYSLRAAVYEFDYEPVIEAFAKARQACGDVKIVYDARIPTSKGVPDKRAKARVAEVRKLLAEHGLSDDAIPRVSDPGYIAHNKFIVLLHDQVPVAVWTGSTNFTESGIFGQSNVGHAVRDPDVARAYLEYWERLKLDPDEATVRQDNAAQTPTLTEIPPPAGITPLFSPRRGGAQLKWYGEAMDSAKGLMCFTAAFGINEVFLERFREDRDILRYVFLEKWGVNATTSAAAQAALGSDHDIQVAVGATLPNDAIHHWLGEQTNTISKMVKYTHTKFMLVDPLGDDPVVISGSANFSDASTSENDENMLVIRGDTRVADIYLGEFMRLWRHYNFRYIVTAVDAHSGVERHNYLSPDDSWKTRFFDPAFVKFRRRTTFA